MKLLLIALHASQLISIVYLIIKAWRQWVEIQVLEDKLLDANIDHLNMMVRWETLSDTVREELKKFASDKLEETEKQLKENDTTRN